LFPGGSLRYLRFMTSEFPILLVTQKAYEASSNETLGSKYKFWFDHEELGRCLYKQSRENLGEDWAEKVASELCSLLGLPHAVYELASTWEGSRGVVSPNFLPQGGTLVQTSLTLKDRNAQLRLMQTNVSQRFMAVLMIERLLKLLMYSHSLLIAIPKQLVCGWRDLKIFPKPIF